VYSEVLVDGLSEGGDDPSECGHASECRPGDSVSQAGAPASVAIDIDYFQTMRFGPGIREARTDTDTQNVASTTVDEGVISAAMLASIRNIELNVERLYLHVDRLHASQAACPRPQRATRSSSSACPRTRSTSSPRPRSRTARRARACPRSTAGAGAATRATASTGRPRATRT